MKADIYDEFGRIHYQLTKLIDRKIAIAMSCFENKSKIIQKCTSCQDLHYELLHLIQNDLKHEVAYVVSFFVLFVASAYCFIF